MLTAQQLGAWLPAVNAGLNSTSAVLLLIGFLAIRRRRVELHRRCMIGALLVSALFLVCYLVRVALTGTHRFPGDGWARVAYLLVLSTHMVLAAVVPFLAISALRLGLRAEFPRHRRVVRWAFPIWLYVSVTGVAVYYMLYHWPR